MKRYPYTDYLSLMVIFNRLAGTLFVILGIAVGVLSTGVFLQDVAADGVLWFGLLWAVGAIFGGLFFVYVYPSVVLDNKGISLTAWPYPTIRIPWGAVTDVYEFTGLKRDVIFVQVDWPLPLHVFYGVYFLHKPRPGFIIRRQIEGFAELQRYLRRRSL